MAPNLGTKIIGVRPGEKIHELMCPNESHHLTLNFNDHYIIFPSPKSFDKKRNFLKNKLGEIGKRVEANFEYSSDKNTNFLSIKQIRKLYKKII